jgi:hypothetical protein
MVHLHAVHPDLVIDVAGGADTGLPQASFSRTPMATQDSPRQEAQVITISG